MTSVKADVATAVDAWDKTEKDREASKSRLAILESEKAALTKA